MDIVLPPFMVKPHPIQCFNYCAPPCLTLHPLLCQTQFVFHRTIADNHSIIHPLPIHSYPYMYMDFVLYSNHTTVPTFDYCAPSIPHPLFCQT